MIRSPNDARKLWCPFARVAYVTGIGPAATAINRTAAAEPHGTNCIADRCMAWRTTTGGAMQGEPGWCGLAGNPVREMTHVIVRDDPVPDPTHGPRTRLAPPPINPKDR